MTLLNPIQYLHISIYPIFVFYYSSPLLTSPTEKLFSIAG